jgi:hypothetical protein
MSVTRADLITRLRNPAHSRADTQNTILHTGTACADMREAANKIESDAKVIAALREALGFYANEARYRGPNQHPLPDDPYAPADSVYIWDVSRDGGSIARHAIEQTAGENK